MSAKITSPARELAGKIRAANVTARRASARLRRAARKVASAPAAPRERTRQDVMLRHPDGSIGLALAVESMPGHAVDPAALMEAALLLVRHQGPIR